MRTPEIVTVTIEWWTWQGKEKNIYIYQVATALLVAGPTLTFWIPWQTLFVYIYQLVLKSLGCSSNCRRLAYDSFQLTHISRDDLAVEFLEPWRPKRRQNVITALTTLPQGWVSARKHQCTTAITTIRTESLWAFPESYTAERWGTRGDKRAHNSTTKVSFCTIIVRLCHCMIAITRV